MDRQAAAQGLRALATSSAKRSKAAQLRDLLEDVEVALAAGVNRSAVVDELAKHGLQMSLATFDSALAATAAQTLRPGRSALPCRRCARLEAGRDCCLPAGFIISFCAESEPDRH